MIVPQHVDYPDTKHLTEPLHDFLHKFDKNCMTDHTTNFEPVLCEKCKYIYNSYANEDFECHHKSNTILYHDWYSVWSKYKKHPKKLNKNNNCPNFEKIETKKKGK